MRHGNYKTPQAQRSLSDDHPPYVPTIDPIDVFRQMIIDELQTNRLTAARRVEMVRYARPLGLSPARSRQLIAECISEVCQSDALVVPTSSPGHAARQSSHRLKPYLFMLSGTLLILLDVVIIKWLR